MERKILIDEETLQARISQLAKMISKDYEGEELTLLCILKGSVFFFTDLARRITGDVELSFIRVSSYVGEESSGVVSIKMSLTDDIRGKNVVVVEDIVDSGNTISAFLQELKNKGAKSVKLCCLLNKPSRRIIKNLDINYLGFTIEDRFVVGYGLDLDEKYRTFPNIQCFTDDPDDKVAAEVKILKKQAGIN